MAAREALLLAICVLGGVAAASATPPPAQPPVAAVACHAEVVRPDHGERSQRFIAWLKGHPDRVPPASSLSDLLARPTPEIDVLIADIDNDGHDEYVVTTSEGSGGYLGLWVWRPTGKDWVAEEAPESLTVMAQAYGDPLLRFCGQVYVALAVGDGPNYSRAALLWKGGKAVEVCDVAWLQEQRREFQRLFDHHQLAAAYAFLEGALADCQPPPDRSTWWWMESDLALTAYKIGRYASCLEHVEAARKSPGFSQASEPVRQAIATNAALCEKAKGEPAPAYDFSWLRSLKRDPEQQFVLDPRFDGLLSAVVPDVKLANGQAFRDVLKSNVFLPERIELVDDRYLVLAGCRPHDCEEKGLIWVDLKTRRGIALVRGAFASTAPDGKGESAFENVLALGSTTIEPGSVPGEFWQQAGPLEGTAEYAGPSGKWQTVTVPPTDEDPDRR